MNLLDKLRSQARHCRRRFESFCKPRVGFHTFWTRPISGEISLPDYEVLTLIVSALKYRETNGPIHLYTDNRGYDYFLKHGLTQLYNEIHVILDEAVSPFIEPRVFWAAGKLAAYKHCAAPCVSIDLDAIIWKKLPFYKDDVVPLHPEPLNWEGYRSNAVFEKFGFSKEHWNWETPAANMGICVFNDQYLKSVYADKALNFMFDYSLSGEIRAPYRGLMGPGVLTYIDEMIFAEQRLLAMTADRLSRTLGFIIGFNEADDHIQLNPLVSHVWNSKRGYKVHGRARETYCTFLLNLLLREHPYVFWKILPKLGLLHSVVRDANVPAIRYSQHGEWALPGELMATLPQTAAHRNSPTNSHGPSWS